MKKIIFNKIFSKCIPKGTSFEAFIVKERLLQCKFNLGT